MPLTPSQTHPPADSKAPSPAPAWSFKVLIDNDCHLCRREAAFMNRLDAGRGQLALEDIAAPDFDPSRYGRSLDQLMGSIHGVLPDGRLVTGVEVFRRAYAAVGYGWLLAPTAWPGLRWLSDRAYVLFAWARLKLPRARSACDNGRCRLPTIP
jgi:predicted DCC family thiol-disulfide oxidoreductase YuxK